MRVAERETRSFEADYVHALWHLDFHAGSRKVLLPHREWATPQLLRLEIREPDSQPHSRDSLEQRILAALQHGPHRLAQLRDAVEARKQSVVQARWATSFRSST